MALLITPALTIPFVEIALAKNVPFDDFTNKIIKIVKDWQEGRAFQMLTSGSTGEPKEILLDREAMKASVRQSVRAFGLEEGDTFLCCLSTDHIAGLMMVIRALETGADLVAIPPSSNPLDELPEGIGKIDFAAFVPLQLENSLHKPELNSLKALIVGGAPVADKLAQRVMNMQVPVYQTYGMTETYTHVALRRLSGQDAAGTYFALEGIHFSKDERDCLIIHAPALKRQALITNDVVELLDSTHFRWLGRFDNIINSGGIKIRLEKIEKVTEAALLQLGKGHIASFATAIPDDKFGQRPALVLEDMQWKEDSLDKFRNLLIENLSKIEMPDIFFFAAQFRRTALGKIDRINTMKAIEMKK